MKPKSIMLVAGDPSGDANAAELVKALLKEITDSEFIITNDTQPLTTPLRPRFFGAGGPKMAEAGVKLAFNLTADSVIGPGDVIKKLPMFLRRFKALVALAVEREPDIIILVDYEFFNRRFARAVRRHAPSGIFNNWRPKIVQYVSPQVWASRPGRADKFARDLDLLLCLFPFEKEWYAKRTPRLRVECAGHPLFDRFPPHPARQETNPPTIVLLPGSRRKELKRHLPVMLGVAERIAAKCAARFKMVLPNDALAAEARGAPNVEIQIGGLAEALQSATLVIAKTGTVTLECAYFGVPTVAIYKTSGMTYAIGRQIVRVKYLAMPNLLANEEVFPEFIQGDATADRVAQAALDLLQNPSRRAAVQTKLAAIVSSLGGPGASQRAAMAILKLMAEFEGKKFVQNSE